MPDVGNLNIEITSNASEASKSLYNVADALSRIKSAVPNNGIGLSKVATELNQFAKQINQAKATNAVLQNIANFGKGLKDVTSAIKATNKDFDTSKITGAIDAIKASVGDGIKLGQSGTQMKNLREALGGDWNTENASKAGTALSVIGEGAKSLKGTNLGTIAKNISATAASINEYVDAAERLKSVMSGGGDAEVGIGNIGSVETGANIAQGLQQGVDAEKNAAVSSVIDMAQELLNSVRSVLGIASPSKEFEKVGEYSMEGLKQGLVSKSSEVQSVAGTIAESILGEFEAVSETIQTAGSSDGIQHFTSGVKEMKSATSQSVSEIEILTKDLEKLQEKLAGIEERVSKYGGDLLDNSTYRALRKQEISLERKIENMTALNADATTPESNGAEAVRDALGTSVVDLKRDELNARLEEISKAYDQGRMSVSQFNKEMQNIQKGYGKLRELEAQKQVFDDIKNGLVDMSNATSDNISKMDVLTTKLQRLRELASERTLKLQYLGIDPKEDDTFIRLQGQIVATKGQIEKLEASAQKAQEAMQFDALKANADDLQRDYGGEMVENLVDNYSQIDLLTMKLEGLKQALADDINQNKVDTQQIAERTIAIKKLKDAIDELKNAQEEASGISGALQRGFSGIGEMFKKLFPSLTKTLHMFVARAKSMAIRAIIRQISAGVREGIQNVYQYSKAIGTSFAPTMDAAASSLLQMKNSIGAALAPALQSIIPVIQSVVNWFITGINYINQFFALIRGQKSWTRAVATTTEAYKDQTKAAKSAGAAVKDLLADWDELNIIQSQGGGGGGGGNAGDAEDYLKMFEEVNTFDDKVKKTFDFIKNNFDTIKGLAEGIGAAILGWKLAKAFTDYIPFLSKLGNGIMALATIGITVELTDLTGKKFLDTGEPGWFIADALTGAVGSTIAGELAAKIAGAAVGEVTRGFTLILSGIVNIINAVTAAEQETEGKDFMLGVLGSIEIGIGSALAAMGFGAGATASLATGLVTGVASLTIAIALILEAKRKASYRQMAIDAFKNAGVGGISAESYMKALQKRLDELTQNSQLVINASIGFDETSDKFKSNIESLKSLNALVTGTDALTEEDAKKFKEAWGIVMDSLREMQTINNETILAGLDEIIADKTSKLREAAIEYRKEALYAAGIMKGAQGKLEEELRLLENEIIAGPASESDADIEAYNKTIERYEKIYSTLAQTTETGIEEFRTALLEGASFDFSSEENPIQAAVDFINSIGTDLVTPALEQVQAQAEAELKNVQQQLDLLEYYKDLDLVDDNTYKRLKDFYEGLKTTYTDRLEEQKKEIKDSTQEAFDSIIESAIKGYESLDQADSSALEAYVDNVFAPLYKAIEEAGGEVPEKLKAIMARGGKEAWQASTADQLRESSRVGIYQSFVKDMEAGNIEDALTFSIAFEYGNAQNDPTKIGEDAARDIVNSMIDVFNDQEFIDFDTIFNQLSKTFGWSIQDIIGYINLDDLQPDQLQDLMATIEQFQQSQEDSLMNDYLNGKLDWWQYQEQLEELQATYAGLKEKISDAVTGISTDEEKVKQATGAIAGYYAAMAAEILRAMQSLDGIGFGIGGIATGGLISTKVRGMATGGFVKSGDLIMANENGNIEMMGKMGQQPVVANNQQIVSGISSGVAQANSGVESRLGNIETLMMRLLQKEFVAKAVPSASWGEHSARSAERYDLVTG